MLDAIAYMHSNNIIHCDLKPENIMCTSSQGKFDIKITDFGLSKVWWCCIVWCTVLYSMVHCAVLCGATVWCTVLR